MTLIIASARPAMARMGLVFMGGVAAFAAQGVVGLAGAAGADPHRWKIAGPQGGRQQSTG
jgi:hypothetical protein